MFFKKYKEIINYLFFGFLTVVVTFITYLLFINVLLPEKNDLTIQIANIISWVCAVAFAYITNRKFVFESKTKGKKQIDELLGFISARIASLFVDMGLMYLLYSLMHFDDTISKIIVQVVVVIMNYVLSKVFIFKKENGNS